MKVYKGNEVSMRNSVGVMRWLYEKVSCGNEVSMKKSGGGNEVSMKKSGGGKAFI